MNKDQNSPTGSQSAELTGYAPIVDSPIVNWFEINSVGLPPKEQDEFYGDRYSVPVLIANAITGQVEHRTVVYDYQDGGWCLVGLPYGPSCHEYELLIPTHYCLLPQFAI
jgi:hypothetical protein